MLETRLENVLRTTKKHLYKLENALNIKQVKDLIHFYPRNYEDKSTFRKISEIQTDETNTIKGRLKSIYNIKTKYGKTLTKGVFTDGESSIEVIWFNQRHLTKMLPQNKDIVLSGKAKFAYGKVSLQSPSFELLEKHKSQIHSGRIIPIYHETEGISSKWLREKLSPIIKDWLKYINDYMPEDIIKEEELWPLKKAVLNVHFPENAESLKKARERLAFDELFLLQLKVLQKKWYWQNINKGEAKNIDTKAEKIKKLIEDLEFSLTNAQNRVIKEILEDMQQAFPMIRLLQGDVGSGKTIVAAIIALNTVLNNYQVAIMAPTEILAKQHYKSISKLLRPYGLNIQFIAGSTRAKEKENIITQMKTGTADLIIGTHALIQDKIGFKNLGLAIIDEQHRFGVKQREKLKSFNSPHLLSMTATPIPRTLAITLYGDQDLSIIDEMPKGRQKIITRHVSETKRMTAYRWIEDQIQKGRQAYIICPLIEESENLNLKSVLNEYEYLSTEIFPNLKLSLLHGKLKQEEKDQIMQDFKDNKTQILVSTSVIEVGIDVPNSSIMMIEGAERFGLSQLHQFRGRVGRGKHQSYCFLFTNSLSQDGKIRMKAMEQHTDGFKLSEIDLNLRGPGEVYGVKQSGIPDLKMATLSDSIMIDRARNAALKIIKKDPLLKNYPKLNMKIAESYNKMKVDD